MELDRLIDWTDGAIGQAYSDLDDPLAGNDARAANRDTVEICQDIAHILRTLADVRRECDYGPLRELNDGRPDVLCLDFTGPAEPLRRLTELLGGGK